MAAKRFGPVLWNAEVATWPNNGFTEDLGPTNMFVVDTASTGKIPLGNLAGRHEFHAGTFSPNEMYVDGFDAAIIDVRGYLLFQKLSLSVSAADNTDLPDIVRYMPFEVRTSGGSTVVEGRIWKDAGGVYRCTFALNGSAGFTYSSDFQIIKDRTYQYRLRVFSGNGVNRMHVTWSDGSGIDRESVVSGGTPIGQADEVRFRWTEGANLVGGDEVDIAHSLFEVRSAETFQHRFVSADTYLSILEAQQVRGDTQFAQLYHSGPNLVSAQYEWNRAGGCGTGTFEIVAPGHLDGRWYGQGLKNEVFARPAGGGGWTFWVEGTTGAGFVNEGTGDDAFAARSPRMGAADSTVDEATLYHEMIGSLLKDRKYRIRVTSKEETLNEMTLPICIKIENRTQGTAWNGTSHAWEPEASWTKGENDYSAGNKTGWTTWNVNFHTLDRSNQIGDIYRVTILTNTGSPGEAATFNIGACRLQVFAEPEIYDILKNLENLGSIELFTKHELGTLAAHPYDGRDSEYRRIYAGYIDSVAPDIEKGTIKLSTRGWSELLGKRVSGTASVHEGKSIATIMSDELTNASLVAASPTGPFYTSSIGEAGSDPTDRIIAEFDPTARTLRNIVDDLAALTPDDVTWGVDGDREFFFKAIGKSYETDPTVDNTIYSIDLEAEGREYRERIRIPKTTKVTVFTKEDDDGNRVSGTVENAESSDKHGRRDAVVIREAASTAEDAQRFGQLILQEESNPVHVTKHTFGPSVFFTGLERNQIIKPVMVRDGSKRGRRFGSDGPIFNSLTTLGAAKEYDSAKSQYSTFTSTRTIGTSDAYQIHITAACPDIVNGVEYTLFSNGTSGGNKFIRVYVTELTGPARLQMWVLASLSGTPTSWSQVWQHDFADTAFEQTTNWTFAKLGSSAAMRVFANGSEIMPSGGSTAFVHGAASSGAWVIAARHSDSPDRFFLGKLDDFIIRQKAINTGTGGGLPGSNRYSRDRGKGMVAAVFWDEATRLYYWRGQNSVDASITDSGLVSDFSSTSDLPVFTGSLKGLDGSGAKWGDGSTYGSYTLLSVEKIVRKWEADAGFETSLELGTGVVNVEGSVEELDRRIQRLAEVVNA